MRMKVPGTLVFGRPQPGPAFRNEECFSSDMMEPGKASPAALRPEADVERRVGAEVKPV